MECNFKGLSKREREREIGYFSQLAGAIDDCLSYPFIVKIGKVGSKQVFGILIVVLSFPNPVIDKVGCLDHPFRGDKIENFTASHLFGFD